MLNMPTSLKLVPEKPTTSQAELASGRIYETDCFKDGVFFIDDFAQKNPGKRISAKVDLDNTCVTYGHTLGTDHWFDDGFKKLLAQGLSLEETKKTLLDLYLEIVRNLHPDDIQLVEQDTPAVLRNLQTRGVDVVALTSRGSYILEETLAHLEMYGINFNQGTYANKEKVLPQSVEGLFIKGMILTGGKHKGECMMAALEGNLADLIVMWDDKLENLERVRASIAKYNELHKEHSDFSPVQFIGIRYSRLDHVIKNVDRRVVEIQERCFKKILSDKHALAIHKAEQKEGRRHYIGIDYQPQNDRVLVAANKAVCFKSLREIDNQLDAREVKGTLRMVGDKEKVARQFQYTIQEFTTLYPALTQAALIEPNQTAVFDAIFSPVLPTLTPMRQNQAARDQNAFVPPTDALSSLTLSRSRTFGM